MTRLSIGFRLTIWYLTVFALAQLAFGLGMWLILRENLREVTRTALAGEVEDVRRFLESQPSSQPLAALRKAVTDEYSAESDGDYLEISDADGNWIYRSPSFSQMKFPSIARAAMAKSAYIDTRIGDKPFRFINQHIPEGVGVARVTTERSDCGTVGYLPVVIVVDRGRPAAHAIPILRHPSVDPLDSSQDSDRFFFPK